MKRTVVLTFPPTLVDEPVTYHLITDYDLEMNILRATVRPGEVGRLVLGLKGKKKDLDAAVEYLEKVGVSVDPVVQEMRFLRDKCHHCTACIPICPTGALDVDRETWQVGFDGTKCILCESCVPVCSYRAIAIEF
ncbi:MAG: 4Fe-4S binding protein [Proteobacteria bacterium]|nr:4Fe-4S binding protein [Pseudomonadota bacterium]